MTKNEWFAIVRWCEDDIRSRFEELGVSYTDELIATIRAKMEHGAFTGALIELGIDLIDSTIRNEIRNRID